MADTSKKAPGKAPKKAATVSDYPAAKPRSKPKPKSKPKPTLPELRRAWGDTQAKTLDRERNLSRANATQSSASDRSIQVEKAKISLQKARDVEEKARSRFINQQREEAARR